MASVISLDTARSAVLPARWSGGTPHPLSGTFRELQLNLCDSGDATCYTGGRSVPEAASLMYMLRGTGKAPDLVTLNETCFDDVDGTLFHTMADIWPYDDTFYLFAPAVDGASGIDDLPYPCRDGDAYGNAIIGHVPHGELTGLTTVSGLDTMYGIYTAQGRSPEHRSFGCVYLPGHYYACVTHLLNANAAIAMRQCHALLGTVIPAFLDGRDASLPVLIGADLNLHYRRGPYDVQNCVPPGYFRKGDGDVMHVLATRDVGFQRSDRYRMMRTDHDAFLVTLTLPQP